MMRAVCQSNNKTTILVRTVPFGSSPCCQMQPKARRRKFDPFDSGSDRDQDDSDVDESYCPSEPKLKRKRLLVLPVLQPAPPPATRPFDHLFNATPSAVVPESH